MKHALEMLADLPGVRTVLLITPDGVPIAAAGRDTLTVEEEGDGSDANPSELGVTDALAALAVGLLTDLTNAAAQMSWQQPRRIVLRAVRGTIVMQTMSTAVLLVVLERGLRAQELMLSMDGTVARIERGLKNMGTSRSSSRVVLTPDRLMETPRPLPSPEGSSGAGEELTANTEHGDQRPPH